MITWKNILKVIAKCLLYSTIVILVDFVLVVFLSRGLSQISISLSLIMLFEGGICLVAGGAAALYSPLAAKISETIFHSKPWDAKRQKDVEAQAGIWILSGVVLIFAALLFSAL
jgi:hypothetical protein